MNLRDRRRGALAAVRIQETQNSEGVIPEARGELAVEAPRDEAEACVVPHSHVRRNESEPVRPCRGVLVRRQVHDRRLCGNAPGVLHGGDSEPTVNEPEAHRIGSDRSNRDCCIEGGTG